jgi:peptide/nickel transport system substrate-binding protein
MVYHFVRQRLVLQDGGDMTKTLIRVRLSGVATVLALLISACVSSAPQGTATGSPTSAKVADEITVGLNVNPVTLDPGGITNVPSRGISDLINEPLMRQTADGTFIPALALRYERPNNLTWRFFLRSGVRFHDGQPFGAEDVVYSMNRLNDATLTFIDPGSRTRARDIDKVIVVDPMTVDIVTKTPTAFFLTPLSGFIPILPRSAAAAGAGFGVKPVGTGPYKFVSLVPGQQVVLERNDDYWGEKSPTRRIVFKPLIEDSTRLAAFEAGEVQFINNVPVDALARLKSDSRFRVDTAASSRTIYLAMRTARAPLNDVRVRRALAHAIDTSALAKDLFAGLATAADSPFAPLVYGAAKDLPKYAYDPALSKKLLADAGYPNGIHLSYGIPLGNYLQDKQVGEAIAGMLEKAGISVSGYQEIEWATFRPLATDQKKFDIYLYGIGSTDPSMLAHFLSLDTFTDWKPAQRDALMTQIIAGPMDQSLQPLQQIQKLMWDELPEVFLYYQPTLIAVASSVQGVQARVDETLEFSKVRWPGR